MKERINKLLKRMSESVYEKEHIISLALLSAIAGESIFLLGPPGTAKSMVARRLKLIFSHKKCFEYLMSRFSTPDEIFGPVSISKLKSEDVYERSVEGYLPTATVVFLDEIWKAGPAIQNALLTAINERIYQNGTNTIHLPMKTLIAASNELPKEDEGLEALWDRFLVRVVSNCISNEKTFYKMLRQQEQQKVEIPESLCITDEEYNDWQKAIAQVVIPDDTLKMITQVRNGLDEISEKEEVPTLDYYISDRRWKKIVHLLQTSAFLNGRNTIDYSDMYLLAHTLWNKADGILVIWELLRETFFFDWDKQLEKVEKDLDQLYQEWLPTDIHNEDTDYKVHNYFYLKVLNYPRTNCYIFQSDHKHLTLKEQEGVMNWDESIKGYVIRRFDVTQPFAAPWNDQNIIRIKIRKMPGGIIINGQAFLLEKNSPNIPAAKKDYSKLTEFNQSLNSIKTGLEDRIEVLTNGENLFVTKTDVKMVKKSAEKRMKRLEEIEVKLAGLQ